MNIEKQVCSLQLAKRLKKLGVKQHSYFRWEVWHDAQTNRQRKQFVFPGGHTYGDVFSAFTVAELGAKLPWELFMDKEGQNGEVLTMYKDSADQWNFYPRHGKFHNTFNCTEANARAGILVYLIEHNLVTF